MSGYRQGKRQWHQLGLVFFSLVATFALTLCPKRFKLLTHKLLHEKSQTQP